MESPIKPIFLLADSQLLFWRIGGRLFLERVRAALRDEMPAQPIKAIYLGASNRDAPEYYELFVAAMDGIRIRDCRMDDPVAAIRRRPPLPLAGLRAASVYPAAAAPFSTPMARSSRFDIHWSSSRSSTI